VSSLNYASFIWGIAEKLRGPFKRHEYGKVILPFVVLRRLDCALEPTKADVIALSKSLKDEDVSRDFQLQKKSGYPFYNTSPYDLQKLLGDPSNLKANMQAYIAAFSQNLRDVFERYDFDVQLGRLEEEDLLLLVTQEFLKVDLHPDVVDNIQMGHIFEELIAKSMEASNEEAGEYFTPRDVVRLMVNLLFSRDDAALSKPGIVRSIYDPTAGTGGMLSVAQDHIRALNPDAQLSLYGQERNAESYAIAKTDLLIKGQSSENMFFGDTLTNDGHWDKSFDYGLANPPFGVEWKKQEAEVTKEHETRGFNGRFGAGLPRVSDGSLLFVMHLVSKMRPVSEGGGRIGIVLNGSPLTTGAAGSGESEIRQWLLENDLIEAIVALPKDMFYNTGIATYIWLLDNDKPKERRGKVQLIDATSQFQKLRKNVGEKKNEIATENVLEILRQYDSFEQNRDSKIFTMTDFGYTTITIEQPLRLNWMASEERIERLDSITTLAKLGKDVVGSIKKALIDSSKVAKKPTSEETTFTAQVKEALESFALKPTQLKNIISALAETDESAPKALDSKGREVPDRDLRDFENVPMTRTIEEYVNQEIAPYLTDFWIDRTKDKIGYEIPFTRHFHKYNPPQPLEQIDNELNELVSDISHLLQQIEK
jgi:type I restriction enzyme M protein